jgi:hypothetical protein
MTFDLKAAHKTRVEHGWQQWYEAFSICRRCLRSTTFILSESMNGDHKHVHEHGIMKLTAAVNQWLDIEGFISIKDRATIPPPEHLPSAIAAAFMEGATCRAVQCYNAAGTMFRLCADLATRELLPEAQTPGLNGKVRRDLCLRLPWLFENNLLPAALHDLSSCIKEDGNDGAHAGTLKKEDAEDLLDFTVALLERLYREPEQLRLAKIRRDTRRTPAA